MIEERGGWAGLGRKLGERAEERGASISDLIADTFPNTENKRSFQLYSKFCFNSCFHLLEMHGVIRISIQN